MEKCSKHQAIIKAKELIGISLVSAKIN